MINSTISGRVDYGANPYTTMSIGNPGIMNWTAGPPQPGPGGGNNLSSWTRNANFPTSNVPFNNNYQMNGLPPPPPPGNMTLTPNVPAPAGGNVPFNNNYQMNGLPSSPPPPTTMSWSPNDSTAGGYGGGFNNNYAMNTHNPAPRNDSFGGAMLRSNYGGAFNPNGFDAFSNPKGGMGAFGGGLGRGLLGGRNAGQLFL